MRQRAFFSYTMRRTKSNPEKVYPFELLSAGQKVSGKCGLSSTPWNKKQCQRVACDHPALRFMPRKVLYRQQANGE